MNQISIPQISSVDNALGKIGVDADKPGWERFIAFMVGCDIVDEFDAERVSRAIHQTDNHIELVLIELGLVNENQLVNLLVQFTGCPVLEPGDFPVAAIISEEDLAPERLHSCRLLPVAVMDDTIVFATPTPLRTDEADAFAYFLGFEAKLRIVAKSAFDELFEELYGDRSSEKLESNLGQEDVSASDEIDRLRDSASEAPIVRLASRIITQACDRFASDIHIEPFEDRVRVRYRLNGELQTIETFQRQFLSGLISRFKILARLNIAETRLPQDGRIRFPVKGRQIDFRVSTMPMQYGESLVLRILDKSNLSLDFPALGFDVDATAKISNLLNQPNGIFLVTGPTGSGKTTSLYAGLSQLNAESRKIFTVEDPIEYNLPGINQIQVNQKIGLTFASVLRSTLRQDPDVIMIGEIRDPETAGIAVQAALTGHLVLATVHTNSAVEAISRLADMGVEHYLLAATLRGSMSQRLVRHLCDVCSSPAPMSQRELKQMAVSTEQANFRKPTGCEQCGHTGYKGRTTIYEICEFGSELQELISQGAPSHEISSCAKTMGMVDIRECGFRKAAEGLTTLEEVLAVTGD